MWTWESYFISLTEFPEMMNRDTKIPSSLTHLSPYILHVVRYFPFSEFKFSHHFSKKAFLTDFSVPTPRIFWVNMFHSVFVAFPSHNTNCLNVITCLLFLMQKDEVLGLRGQLCFIKFCYNKFNTAPATSPNCATSILILPYCEEKIVGLFSSGTG